MARVLLSKEIQYQLCFSAREKLGVNWAGLARHLQISPSTLTNWYKCIRLLPENIFTELVGISGLRIKKPKMLPDNWGLVKGGKASYLRHGPFWTLEGSRRGGANTAKKVPLPTRSVDLAEFVGIMLGDGGMTYNQISVTLGYTTDKEYVPYIRKLIDKLFKVKTSIYRAKVKDAIRIRASGVNLVKNLLASGLVQGNKIKQPQFNIPEWIKEKNTFIMACIRGMIDTDGCVHRKVRRERDGTEYRSIGITFCSASKPLQISFIKLLNISGFKAAISGRTIYLCGKKQIIKYVDEIGFSNPKHQNRYQNFLKDYNWVKVSSENCLTGSTKV